jgi:hypothetical protein
MRPELLAGEVLPGGLLISAATTTYSADVPDGEGLPFELRGGAVRVTRDGKMWRTDILDDDADAVLAHYDAVKAELLADSSARGGAPVS